jgi:NTE family protein
MNLVHRARSFFRREASLAEQEKVVLQQPVIYRERRKPTPRPLRWPPKKAALALQGGGSFGAFTGGVLDRLLESDVGISAVSGASAGAINSVLLASGLIEGGREAARKKLKGFWRRLSDEMSVVSWTTTRFPHAFDILAGTLSPALFNPFDLNPLRRALVEEVDFDRLRDPRSPRLLIATTRVRDGRLRIFRNDEITVDVVLASSCLPMAHHSVQIDGEAYWDGGYVSNPPILQLVDEIDVDDLLIVQLMPERDDRIPVSRMDIGRRLDQITFNSPLNAELAALELARKMAATPKLRRLRVGRIAAEDEIADLADRSAADLGRAFVNTLHESGRKAADRWLAQGMDLDLSKVA